MTSSHLKLVIGDKRFSSWSLRPWLLLKHFEIPFEEILVPLNQPQTHQEILKFSPSGKVPALLDGKVFVWDSLAIAEYLNEKFPQKQMWPTSTEQRAWARSISSEMHSGFQDLRQNLPHDLHKNLKDFNYSVAQKDIQRIFEIWRACLKESSGPFLFGEFSIADAMYAPVVNRFINYGVKIEMDCQAYVDSIRELPAHQMWIHEALKEKS